MTISTEYAMTIALQAVAFLIADEKSRDGLLRMTGIGPDDLRTGLENVEILGGVLDFLLANEPRLLTFCSEVGLDPELPALARARLLGPDPAW